MLALCFLMPTNAHAAGASCPPGYRLDDDGNCTKIPSEGPPPASGGGSGWDQCSTDMTECLAACVLTWGSCIAVCDAKYVACEEGAPFGL
jgi:hypothetical protein